MDLGIRGRKAIVCAGSKGLGRGCAMALAQAGVDIVLNARGADTLAATANEIMAATGVTVTPVAADITTPEGRAAVLGEAGEVDILVTNAGGPPPGNWRDWSRDDFIAALDANMLAPIAMMQAVLPAMIEQRWGRVVNITSQSVRAPIAQLGLSNSARSGLTGFVAGTSRQVAEYGVNINNLLPGLHATDRAVSLDTAAAKAKGISVEEAKAQREASIPVRRYGTPEEFGATCAFMCSVHAGFMVGQNVMLDGGLNNISI
ncbi:MULTISPECIES: SDR family oxidoreductase [Thioclava]|uniref:Short-chain dehydrogenase n=1 Tax=Thioclava nitratireducens TaxID=1915078 RepID=A0ABN4XHB4_9RHOB|nr:MULTISPECIES: SDR family oxidoreductase [Thioclava]AQS48978.1 short-chain dehydrogenase [Thioclava nitratireducens]OWX99295.1 short-chain dehydrogenase [Thioclava sp. IC9]OWY09961.1 short-chain dehydrogenase [Thioclava sp. F42-5]OWY17250.1 short-chain dehydrogenase [Thioclava sp. JM3]PWE51406.1 SDR family NAD(P)-dependent oxidoreductase [Thioclava sp. NG1]